MRSRLGILLIGFILVSAALVGTEDIPSDFFVDPKGEPIILIVVGTEAASQDIVSAARLAVKIGRLTSGEPADIFIKPSRAVHEHVDFLQPAGTQDDTAAPDEKRFGFTTVDVPDAGAYSGWEINTSINYTLSLWYFDSEGFWGNNDGRFQPWETHEEIQIRFDRYKDTSIDAEWITCLYDDIQVKNLNSELNDFSTWFKVPGLIYRIDNIFVPPSLIVKGHYPRKYSSTGLNSEIMQSFVIPEPWLIVHGMLPQFSLFNTTYTVVDCGAVLDMNTRTGEIGPLYKTPYIVTGNPRFAQFHLYEGESLQFGSYTIKLIDTDVDGDREKAWFEYYLNGDLLESVWGIIDPKNGFPLDLQQRDFPFDVYDTCSDLNGNGTLDPGEITNPIGLDILLYRTQDHCGIGHMWIVGTAEKDVWIDYQEEYYTDDQGDAWLLLKVSSIAVDYVRIVTDDQGTGVEIQVYWLENEKIWYNRESLCDPWDCEPHYQVFLDSYESGWDTIDETYVYQPPGTGLWPPFGLNKWIESNSMFVGNGFLDSNDGHTGYEYSQLTGLFEQNDLDRDNSSTNDCRKKDWTLQANCTDQCDIEDPVTWHGPGVIMVELNISLYETMCSPDIPWVIPGPYLKEPVHFIVTVTDVWFHNDSGITYETIKESILTDKITTDIDETGLVITDTEFDFDTWKPDCSYNIILIGGPVANAVVRQLVAEGFSGTDWETSPGEWEYIKAYSCDILIVAGKDREATAAAVQALMNQL